MNQEDLKKYFTEDGSKVICQYCLKEFRRITTQHLRMHDMTFDEYKFNFPGAPTDHTHYKDFLNEVEVSTVIQKPVNQIDNKPNISSGDDILAQMKSDIQEAVKTQVVVSDESEQFDVNQSEIKFQHKGEIIAFIRNLLPGLKNNYYYRKRNLVGEVLYSFVTDMADPVHRIAIDFPDTFWHNRDFYFESRKQELLKQSKWRYVRIEGVAPTNKEIVDALNNV